jgi:murein DD-endopeptidase MepM/ murein hydrolase activator NlpD
LAAEYKNAGHPYQALLFHDPGGAPAYYSADGKSLQKAFLRSPLRFAARVSSHFTMHRFHPVLKINRPHLGTDYAAPVGTPVQTIANGRVVFAGRKGGDGNMVQIAHTHGYETYYLHLSRILVRGGQNVHQGQRIGLVGATGLATGPHLDFRIRQHGNFVNFERLKLPPSNPVAKSDWEEFAEVRDKGIALLPTTSDHNVTASTAVQNDRARGTN